MSDKRVGGRPKGQKTIATNSQVFAVILERFTGNPPKPTNRNDVMDALNASWEVVNGHFDKLITTGRIANASKGGFFYPVDVFEDRPVSVTAVHGSRYKAECGDQVIELSPREFEKLVAFGAGLVKR